MAHIGTSLRLLCRSPVIWKFIQFEEMLNGKIIRVVTWVRCENWGKIRKTWCQGRNSAIKNILITTDHRPRDDSCGRGWHGAVREAASYRRDFWTVVSMSDRLFYYYTQTENFKRFDKGVVSECTVRMLSGWVAAIGHSPRNLAHAHLSHS